MQILKKKWIKYLIILCIAIVAYISFYGIAVLNPLNVDWLMKSANDLAQHYLGWCAYKKSAWTFPIGNTNQLAFPSYTSIIFTDSIPLFSVFFKILSPILPSTFQFFGLWGLICFILQGLISAKIIQKYINSDLLIIVGSIFFIFAPVYIHRMYGHTSLAGHWILLLSLAVAVYYKELCSSKRIYLYVIIISIFASSIHIYFVALCGLVFFCLFLFDVIITKNIIRPISLIGMYILTGIITMWILGGFSMSASLSGDGLGVYSANLNTFINPRGWWSTIITYIFNDYTDGQYEGFGYLGMGIIILLVLSFVFFVINYKKIRSQVQCLGEIFAVLTLFFISLIIALSPTASLCSHRLYTIPLPNFVTKLWSVFRASGRFIWIDVYIIMIFSICFIARHFSKKYALFIIAFAACLQIYDMKNVITDKRELFTQDIIYQSALTDDEFWNEVATDKKHIVLVSQFGIEKLFSYTNYALENDMTINRFYFARSMNDKITENINNELSELKSNTLYVFSTDDKALCGNYDLNYYLIDGNIVGCKNEVQGFNRKRLIGSFQP